MYGRKVDIVIRQVAIQTESGIERREKGALLLEESRVFIIHEGPPQGSERCVPQLTFFHIWKDSRSPDLSRMSSSALLLLSGPSFVPLGCCVGYARLRSHFIGQEACNVSSCQSFPPLHLLSSVGCYSGYYGVYMRQTLCCLTIPVAAPFNKSLSQKIIPSRKRHL